MQRVVCEPEFHTHPHWFLQLLCGLIGLAFAALGSLANRFMLERSEHLLAQHGYTALLSSGTGLRAERRRRHSTSIGPRGPPSREPGTPSSSRSSFAENPWGSNLSLAGMSDDDASDADVGAVLPAHEFFTDRVVVFYFLIILYSVVSSLLLTLHAMNPMRCDLNDTWDQRGMFPKVVFGLLLYLLFAVVVVAEYNLVCLTDDVLRRSPRFHWLRRAGIILTYVGVTTAISACYFVGQPVEAMYVDCSFSFALGAAAAVLGLYVPYVLREAGAMDTTYRIRLITLFLFASMAFRGVYFWPNIETDQLILLQEDIVVSGINCAVMVGMVVTLRMNRERKRSLRRSNSTDPKYVPRPSYADFVEGDPSPP